MTAGARPHEALRMKFTAPLAFAAAAVLLAALGCSRGSQPYKPSTAPADPEPRTETRLQDNCDYWEQQATGSMGVNDWPRAHSYIDEAIKRCPKNDKFLYEKGLFFLLAGEYAACLDTAKKAEALKNEVQMARHLQGQCLLGLKRRDEAISLFKALCADPLFVRNADSCGQLGEQQLASGDVAAAKQSFTRMVQLAGDDARGQYYLGLIARSEKNWPECSRRCSVAFNLAQKRGMADQFLPTFGPVYAYCAADCELQQGNTPRARELCVEACSLSESSESCMLCNRLIRGE